MYYVLDGEVRLDAGGPRITSSRARAARLGWPKRWPACRWAARATVTRAGHALRLDHEELFEVLADHIDLLQGLFSGC